MLTKGQCEEALDRVARFCSWFNPYKCPERIKFKNELDILFDLIEEHFDNPQIDWLKNCMGEEAFNLIFSSQEEVNKWFDRMRWHVKKCDEYGRELDILKNNPPLEWEELKEGIFVWDNKHHTYIKIDRIWESYNKAIYFYAIGWECCENTEYEPNRFYRKEVVE